MKEKCDLRKRKFSVLVPHPKRGEMVWTCGSYNWIKDEFKSIGLQEFE